MKYASLSLREFHGVKAEVEEMNSAKILIAKLDGYQLGMQQGKTMAEVDAYYEGLLKEIEELEKLLELRDLGIEELEEEHAIDT